VANLNATSTVGAIVLVHVLHVVDRNEGVVDSDNVDIVLLCGGAHDKAKKRGMGKIQ
jgi:hypothetical protein